MEIINLFQIVNNIKINYKIGNRRLGDIEKIYSDSSFISKELSWMSKISTERALIDAWCWQKFKDEK